MAKFIKSNLIDILNFTSTDVIQKRSENPKVVVRLGNLHDILTKCDKLWSKKGKEKGIWAFQGWKIVGKWIYGETDEEKDYF